MLARVSHVPEVAAVASPYLPGGKVQVSRDGRTAYATVNFTQAADNLDHADINRVVAVAATAAREPGLAVELGGKAISNTEQAPLSSAVGDRRRRGRRHLARRVRLAVRDGAADRDRGGRGGQRPDADGAAEPA